MPILTPRLLLRPMDAADAAAVLDYKRESWDEFSKWMIWVHPPAIEHRTVGDDEKFCAYMQEKFVKRESITCLVFRREDGRLIGNGGLHHCDWETRQFTLGFAVRTSETKKGYATEIGAALAHYAFDALGAKRIISFHADGNIGSQRTIEKLGFKKEEVLPQKHELANGRRVDEHHYGLTEKSALPALNVTWES